MSATLELKGEWEVGYYSKDADKITVFVSSANGFEIKPADDVFKKPDENVEALKLVDVKVSFSDAQIKAKEQYAALFPSESIGDGFVVLQSFKGKILWNFSSISKTLKFLNVKIDAISGELASHQTISLVQK